MPEIDSEPRKKLTVSLDEKLSDIPTYELTVIKGTSEYMEVQLANKSETADEINILVECIFRIHKSSIPQFARQFTKYLQEFLDNPD